eukprot:m.30677 g.30677  ORF g.30677 m.30677 type:complete len:68 (+) comp6821_c0_seq1:2170-2373(+)
MGCVCGGGCFFFENLRLLRKCKKIGVNFVECGDLGDFMDGDFVRFRNTWGDLWSILTLCILCAKNMN